MERFSAEKYLNIGSSLEWLGNEASQGRWNHPGIKDSAERMAEQISADLKDIGCTISSEAAMRFSGEISITKEDYIQTRLRDLKDVIWSEMGKNLFLWVPADRARFYEYPENQDKWNDSEKAIEGKIRDRFCKAANEINRARIAYALAQWTPCVFHLMRACEVGLKALYKTLGIAAPKLSDSWGNLLRPLDGELKKNPPTRHGSWATHPDFFDHATNDVRAIKRAWRDTTMHIESDYDERGALKALNAVTSFFENLASHLDQDGNFHP